MESTQQDYDSTESIPITFEGATYFRRKKLGRGGFGTTFLYETHTEPPKQIAVKILIDPTKDVQKEQNAWRTLGYNTKVQEYEKQQVLIMPFLGEISLMDYLKGFILKHPDEELILLEMLETFTLVLDEIAHLNAKGLIHPDAYYDNFLINKNKVYLIDFDDMLSIDTHPQYIVSDIIQVFDSINMLKDYARAFGISRFDALDHLETLKDSLISGDVAPADKVTILTILKTNAYAMYASIKSSQVQISQTQLSMFSKPQEKSPAERTAAENKDVGKKKNTNCSIS